MEDLPEIDSGDTGEIFPPMKIAGTPRGNLLLRATAAHEHNIDAESEEGKSALMKTVRKADYSGKVIPPNELLVRYWRVHENRAKEGTRAASYGPFRMVLVTTDGKSLATFSPAAIEALSLAVACYGRDPWDPPVRVRATLQPGGEHGQWLELAFIGRAAPQVSKK